MIFCLMNLKTCNSSNIFKSLRVRATVPVHQPPLATFHSPGLWSHQWHRRNNRHLQCGHSHLPETRKPERILTCPSVRISFWRGPCAGSNASWQVALRPSTFTDHVPLVKGVHHDVTSIFQQPLHSWRQEKVGWKGLRNAINCLLTFLPVGRLTQVQIYHHLVLQSFCNVATLSSKSGFLRSQHWETELFASCRLSPRPLYPNDLVVCPGSTQMQIRRSSLIPSPGSVRSSSCRIQ